MAGLIKMPLGTEVGLGPSDIVLDGDPAPSPKRGQRPQIFGPCLLWLNSWMNQEDTAGQFSAEVYCGQTAKSIKMSLGMEVGLDSGHIA